MEKMDSTRRPKRGSKRHCHTVQRKITQPADSRPEAKSEEPTVSNTVKKSSIHGGLKKVLVRQSSPMNPYNKFEYPMIPCQLTRLEELTAISNNFQSPECGTPTSATPIESCFQCPKDPPSTENEAVRSAVIGSDCCAKEEQSRKEFYYTVKAKVERAVKRHKIFLLRGDLPMLTRALEARGWIQKYESVKTRMQPYDAAILESKYLGDMKLDDSVSNEKALTFQLLHHVPPDFIWDCRNDFVEWDSSLKSQVLLNRFQRSSVYTSKLGMAQMLEDAHWHYEENVSSVAFPRSYNPSRDAKVFVDAFRRSAVVGLLKWFVLKIQGDEKIVDLGNESISIRALEFAVNRCEDYLADDRQEKLDQVDVIEVTEDEWKIFLEDYSRVLHRGWGISNSEEDSQTRLEKCYSSACVIIEKMRKLDPQYEINGMRNIWILKPSHLCCGTGIVMSHCVDDIFRRVHAKPKDYFAVQKYIENPLLIRGTKFDIRVWYLVTNTLPLTIWMFEEALLRFSSHPYSISSYHEAIHLCNTAIQQKYDYEKRRRRRRGITDETIESIRDQGWDCTMLNEYLKTIGNEGEPYFDTIYPKMCQAIVLTMLSAQEHMDRRKSSFELYGADFMVLDDLSVWLIEINTNPRMHPPSSRITQRLYDNVLESLVKVVMDLTLDPNADTGGFRLAYKQIVSDFIPYLGPGLFVFGKRLTLHEYQEEKDEDKNRTNICSPWGRQTRARTAPPTSSRRRKDPKIVDFIDCLDGSSQCRVGR